MRYRTKDEAVHAFVGEFNAFPTDMIQRLMESGGFAEADEWTEVTLPAVGDRVCVFDAPRKSSSDSDEGEIIKVENDRTYVIRMDDGVVVRISSDDGDFAVSYDGYLPMWGTMWQFSDPCDIHWMEEDDGVETMSRLGFRIYYHEEWGYFFGIDGAGFDFYEAFWTPLYDARGLKWHDEDG